MLRLIHNQVGTGGLLVDDIDDGLPNQTVDRPAADSKALKTDGPLGKVKQACYVPYYKPGDTSVAGYIDLDETSNVMRSAAAGKIAGFVASGALSTVSLVASDLSTPVITTAVLDLPGVGDVTITGTGLLSVDPELTYIAFTGTGAVTLSEEEVVDESGGSVGATTIVIPAALIAGLAEATTSAMVTADAEDSNVVALIQQPRITLANLDAPGAGDLTLTGTGFLSSGTNNVQLTGTGAVIVTKTAITGGGGTFTNTSIVIPTALIPGAVTTATSARVIAEGLTSAAVALT